MTNYGDATERKLSEVHQACERDGGTSIIALAGVPGTGKSMLASVAAQRLASQPEMVREVQFHQSYSYEEFIEGMRVNDVGGVTVEAGIFLEWNEQALEDRSHRYVLLIEELTRANLQAVLGELMTYIEDRKRRFTTVYSRRRVGVADNLIILATYNPTDRSAIEVDAALLRRMRVIPFPPCVEQLGEMLEGRLTSDVISALQSLFVACKSEHEDDYEHLMPFGHGVFSKVKNECPDLHRLWVERLRHMLRRPLVQPHKFTRVIEANYPWKSESYKIPKKGAASAGLAAEVP